MLPEVKSEKKLVCMGLKELGNVAKEIIHFAGDCSLWLFDGDLGAGKTTLIKEICLNLGIRDNVTSPTFSLINEYQDKDGKAYYHCDFYRIRNEDEALNIGLEEYFSSGSNCLVEWPAKVKALIPDKAVTIRIEPEPDGSRSFYLSKK